MPHQREPLAAAELIARRFMQCRRSERHDYMFGVGLRGILDLFEATQDEKYLDFYLWQGRLETASRPWNAQTAKRARRPTLDLALFELTHDRRWLIGLEEAGATFLADPRRDAEGSLLDPRGRYTVDCLAHYFPYPVTLAHYLKDWRLFDDAKRQLDVHEAYVLDPVTGVWFSRWGHGRHPGRNNPGLWARGNGWLVAAWGRCMHLWDPKHPAYADILARWQKLCANLAVFQAPSGLFRQLLNRPDCFEEATGSGLFADGFAHGVRFGTLPATFAATAWTAGRGLDQLVDDAGNIHNASTYAGGYDFERQYYSCGKFNDPHGDGTVMSGCVAVHMLTQLGHRFRKVEPKALPVIVTRPVAGCVTSLPPTRPRAVEVAVRVLPRCLKLKAIPESDPFGSIVLGLLQWHRASGARKRDRKASPALAKAQALFAESAKQLPAAAGWNLQAEFWLQTQHPLAADIRALRTFVDNALRDARRDRAGLVMDSAGGYSVNELYVWLPLLAKTGKLTGEQRFFDEACQRLFGYRNWLEDPSTRLWHAAFGHGSHTHRVSPGLWALGNGYVLAGACGLLEYLPPTHPDYVDVLLFLRRYAEAVYEWMPVYGGYFQVMTDLQSFRCAAATGLIGYGLNRALVHGWLKPEFCGAGVGTTYHLGELVDAKGHFQLASRPEGACESLAAWEKHCTTDDPGALGFILMGLAQGHLCDTAGISDGRLDLRLGAR